MVAESSLHVLAFPHRLVPCTPHPEFWPGGNLAAIATHENASTGKKSYSSNQIIPALNPGSSTSIDSAIGIFGLDLFAT